MDPALILKLEHYVRLSERDKRASRRLCSERVRTYSPNHDIISEGDTPQVLNIMLQGWACRYKLLENGRRQIIAFFLPGDVCDLNIFILRQMDHSVAALTPVSVAQITPERFDALTSKHGRITQALLWDTLVTTAIQREWTVSLGQRTAAERLAHLLCELFHRLRVVGLTNGGSFELPVTQAELADGTGISTVHVNRTLQGLRRDGLIDLNGRSVTIPDIKALQLKAMFNSNYLHLEREGAHMDANE